MSSTDPVSSSTNCHCLTVSYMTQYTASSSRNAQLSQLDLVFNICDYSMLVIQTKIRFEQCRVSRSQSKCTDPRPTPPSTAHHTHTQSICTTPHIAHLVFVITIAIVAINRYAMIFYQHQISSCLGSKLSNKQDV